MAVKAYTLQQQHVQSTKWCWCGTGDLLEWTGLCRGWMTSSLLPSYRGVWSGSNSSVFFHKLWLVYSHHVSRFFLNLFYKLLHCCQLCTVHNNYEYKDKKINIVVMWFSCSRCPRSASCTCKNATITVQIWWRCKSSWTCTHEPFKTGCILVSLVRNKLNFSNLRSSTTGKT